MIRFRERESFSKLDDGKNGVRSFVRWPKAIREDTRCSHENGQRRGDHASVLGTRTIVADFVTSNVV